MFKSKNYSYHTLNETNKCSCLFFKTCNNEVQICLIFIEILLRIYLNLTKNIYEILTKKYTHNYSPYLFHDECFTHAYLLMYKFLGLTSPSILIKIYAGFVPNKDYDSRCFKIINTYYLKHISEKKKKKRKKR